MIFTTKISTAPFFVPSVEVHTTEGTTFLQSLLSQVMAPLFEAKFSPWLQWETGTFASGGRSGLDLSKLFDWVSLSLCLYINKTKQNCSAGIGSRQNTLSHLLTWFHSKRLFWSLFLLVEDLSCTNAVPTMFLVPLGHISLSLLIL